MRAASTIMNQVQKFAEVNEIKPPNFSELGSRVEDLEIDSEGLMVDTSEISLETYRKMRTDPQVRACLTVLKLPILQVDAQLTADTEEGKKLALWADKVLSEYMDDSMQYYIREMLTALDFGRSVTEKVWALENVPLDFETRSGVAERIIPQKLKTYDPRNIKIKLNPVTMKLEGAMQGDKLIPADKILIYSHDKEFGNYHGEAALRAAYKPFIIKEFLQKFWNIALERYGTPLQSMKMPQGGSITKAMQLMDMVKSKTGIPLPEGYELEIHNLANAGMSFKEAIEYQDTQIARAMLIPDLVFGNSGTGAFALSKTHSAMFLLRLNGITQELGDIISKYLVKPMIQYNFGEVAEYPVYKFSDVAEEDIKQLAEVIDMMITGKVIAPSEAWIRERLGMPAPDEESAAYLETQRSAAQAGINALAAAGGGNPPKPNEKDEDPEGDPKPVGKKKPEDFAEMDDDELIDYYMHNMRASVNGLLKMGL